MPPRDAKRILAGAAAVVAVAVLTVPVCHGETAWFSLKELGENSEIVVKVRVERIDADSDKADTGNDVAKIATARVEKIFAERVIVRRNVHPPRQEKIFAGEIHEGDKIRFVASPIWACDESHAEEGETIVLMLMKVSTTSLLILENIRPPREHLRKGSGAVKGEKYAPKPWRDILSLWEKTGKGILYQIANSGQGRLEYTLINDNSTIKPVIRLSTREEKTQEPATITWKGNRYIEEHVLEQFLKEIKLKQI